MLSGVANLSLSSPGYADARIDVRVAPGLIQFTRMLVSVSYTHLTLPTTPYV